MNTIKPLKLRHVSGVVTVETINRLIDAINAMSDRVYTSESRVLTSTCPLCGAPPSERYFGCSNPKCKNYNADPRRVHVKDNREARPE